MILNMQRYLKEKKILFLQDHCPDLAKYFKPIFESQFDHLLFFQKLIFLNFMKVFFIFDDDGQSSLR